MSQRLYYHDSYTHSFEARVTEQTALDGKVAIVLDGSYFYPTSGGQPHDIGLVDDIPVLNVQIRETDGAVLHIMDTPPTKPIIQATINWARRFDHMQQHTG